MAARDPALPRPRIFLGGGGWFAWKGGWDGDGDEWRWSGGPNLIVLLVLFAGIALLFTTRYHGGSSTWP